MAVRLESRREEIEHAALTRVYAVAGPARAVGVEYAEGLRIAVAAAVDFGLGAVADGDGSTPAIPTRLLAQARLAARHGVGLGTVLRRYSAGYTLLGQFLVEEAERAGVPRGGLVYLLEVQAMLFDRVVEAVTEEYGRERVRPASVERRRVELIRGLLDGVFVDAATLAYDFDAHHLALIARGPGASVAVEGLAGRLGGRRLVVAPDENTVWAWLGHDQRPCLDELDRQSSPVLSDTCVAVGEPGRGIVGWRHTHRQAGAALLVATRRPVIPAVRYRDVALLASIVQDELLARSLRDIYIEPLHKGRDDGDALIETLHAYFAAARNGASAAAALGVSRQTVDYRLRAVENRVGIPLTTCMTTVEVALELYELERATPFPLADVNPQEPTAGT